MKLTSFLDPNDDTASMGDLAGALMRGSRIVRSAPPGRAARRAPNRIPEPPPLGADDSIAVSVEAAYLMVGDRYDPRWVSPNELVDMTELMLAGRAISRSDQALLLRGPKGKGYPAADAGMKRNVIADWQDQLAACVGRSHLSGVVRATRALGILGRVAVTRMPR